MSDEYNGTPWRCLKLVKMLAIWGPPTSRRPPFNRFNAFISLLPCSHRISCSCGGNCTGGGRRSGDTRGGTKDLYSSSGSWLVLLLEFFRHGFGLVTLNFFLCRANRGDFHPWFLSVVNGLKELSHFCCTPTKQDTCACRGAEGTATCLDWQIDNTDNNNNNNNMHQPSCWETHGVIDGMGKHEITKGNKIQRMSVFGYKTMEQTFYIVVC